MKSMDRWNVSVVALLTLIACCTPALGQPFVESVQIGFSGHYKAGHWTRVALDVKSRDAFKGRIRLSAHDSDGVSVKYPGEEAVSLAAGSVRQVVRYVKFGRLQPQLVVEFLHEDGTTTRTSLTDQLPKAKRSTARFVVVVGGSPGLSKDVRGESLVAVELAKTTDLPDRWLGYEGVDNVILLTSNAEALADVTEVQWTALHQWVHQGGRIALCVGARGADVFRDGYSLAAYNPGTFEEVARESDAGELEALVRSSERLSPFEMSVISEIQGRVEASTNFGRNKRAMIIRSPRGLGMAVIVTADLDQAPFATWPDRAALVTRILNLPERTTEESLPKTRGQQLSHLGYADIVGQLRGALDRFSNVTSVGFTPIAILVALYGLLIGPGDYLLMRYLGCRMHWSWLTFLATVLLFSVGAYLLTTLKARQLRINQVDVVDVDSSSGQVRGTSWAHLYAPHADAFDLQLKPRLQGLEQEEALLAWQGLPGTGLGGMASSKADEVFRTFYGIRKTEVDGGHRIEGLPIQVSATKSLAGRWTGKMAVPDGAQLRADDQGYLSGSFKNPFDFELRDAVIMSGNKAYSIPGKLTAGEKIILEELKPKALRWRLQRRRVIQTRDYGKPWDRTDLTDIPRILEIMMFYQAAGGRSYTQLTHRYQPYLDSSDLVQIGRAVLVGTCTKPLVELRRGDDGLSDNYDTHLTLVRVVFPVSRDAP